jgi:hypothetical protein
VLKFCFLETSSSAYDLPVFLLGIPVMIQMVRCMEEEATDWHRAGVVVLSLGAAAVTIKISAIVLAVTAVVVLFAWMGRSVYKSSFRLHAGKAQVRANGIIRIVLSWIPLAALLSAGWMITNVIYSGYPLAPSTVAGVNLDWKMPHTILDSQLIVIRAWARDWHRPADQVLASWDWFTPWLKGVLGYFYLEVDIPLIIALLALLILGVMSVRKKQDCGGWAWLLLLPPVFGLTFWFVTAPDQRFAGVAFWWLGAGAVALVRHAWKGATAPLCWLPVVLLSLILTCWFDMRLTKLVKPGPLPGGQYPIPASQVKSYTTDSGLTVLIPSYGDQVWDSSLPATPYPERALRLRRPGDIESGFTLQSGAPATDDKRKFRR